MNLFLVEDDEIIAKSLEEYLTSWGHKVTCVRDFTRVAQEVREVAPDLVIMDVVLPSYNGFYWCQQIRAFSTLPILILSSKSDDMDLIQGMQMGADDYVTKPVSLEARLEWGETGPCQDRDLLSGSTAGSDPDRAFDLRTPLCRPGKSDQPGSPDRPLLAERELY